MRHPLDSVPDRTPLFICLLVFTILISIVMGVTGTQLNTTAAPNGIVSFEIAGTNARAQEILDSWDVEAKIHAGFIQGLDFLYLCVYSTTAGLGCLMAGGVLRNKRWPLANLAGYMAWGLWVAALFDAIENIALVVLLLGTVGNPWPQIAWLCALLKFGLLFLGLTYAFYGLVVRLVPQGTNNAVYR